MCVQHKTAACSWTRAWLCLTEMLPIKYDSQVTTNMVQYRNNQGFLLRCP